MSYGLTYLELLDKYGQGPERTATVGTVFAVFVVVTCMYFYTLLVLSKYPYCNYSDPRYLYY